MKQIQLPSGGALAVHFWGRAITENDIPMVLVHGFCEDAGIWSELTPHLNNIPGISVDLPGFGHSTPPSRPEMGAYALALEEALAALNIRCCVLIGHSLGGYVTLEFAATYADRLAGFGLFHSHPFEDDEVRKTNRRRGIEMLEAGKKDLYVTQLFPGLFAPEFIKEHPEVLERVTEQGKRQSEAGIISALKAMMNRRDHQATLQQAGCPLLFLLGEQDTLVPLESAWEVTLLPKVAEVCVLLGVGHMGMLEEAATSAEALKSFYAMAGMP